MVWWHHNAKFYSAQYQCVAEFVLSAYLEIDTTLIQQRKRTSRDD
nr:MAG TPA: hypothetical protein [Caudoviricetes sp.]